MTAATREIIVDNFAGGGGASTGIWLATGRHPDIAINHDDEALAMHEANHPGTEHYCESVWDVDPRKVTAGRPVGLAWFSPDCKHFSKAKGGKPVDKNVRGLAWVAVRWAATVKPRIIVVENVEEFVTWGPLVEGADGKLRPCPKRKGQEFNAFTNALRRHGYHVEYRELRGCDFGAPTIRKRLFLVARRDGMPIRWPEPTHGDPGSPDVLSGRRAPWRTAAECIDWSIPCPSIFERKRPLADATLRRIAKGLMRYVVNSTSPFIVPVTHQGDKRVHSVEEPFRTITSAHRGELALAVPFVSTYYGDKRPGDVRGQSLDEPIATQTTENRHALVTAFLAKHYGGGCTNPAASLETPLSTVTAIDHHSLVAAHIQRDFGGSIGQEASDPLRTVTAGGNHFAEVRAFLIQYYGSGGDPRIDEPLHTATTKDRFGLVTVNGADYAVADIGLRMLTPRELYRAQGFPDSYIIGDDRYQGLRLTKEAQVRMCGNSVCPPVAAALIEANLVRWDFARRWSLPISSEISAAALDSIPGVEHVVPR